MAKFVVEYANGTFGVTLEGSRGEELSPDQVLAYSMMRVDHSLVRIADRLEDLAEISSRIPDPHAE